MSGGAHVTGHLQSTRVALLALPAIICFEALLFFGYVNRQVAPYFPDNFDQAAYLLDTYGLYETLTSSEALLKFSGRAVTGFLLETITALVFLLTGPSRLVALSMNFFAFVGLQLAIFNYFVSVRNASLGIAAIGMLLAVNSIFIGAGGLTDFRLDFAALCLYGIFAVLIQGSAGFQHRRYVIAAAAVAVLLVFTRTFTAIYVAGFISIVMSALIISRWVGRHAVDRERLINILIFIGISGLAIAATVYPKFAGIVSYYVAGHLSAQGWWQSTAFGISDLTSHLVFYPTNLWGYHLGKSFHFALLLTFAAYLLKYAKSEERFDFPWLMLALFLFPLFVLTLNPSKSPLVISIVVVPLIVFLLVPLQHAPRWLTGLTAVTLLIIGGSNNLEQYRVNPHSWTYINYFERLNRSYEKIIDTAVALKRDPIMFVDHESKVMSAGVVQVMGYEKTRRFPNVGNPFERLDKSAIPFPFRALSPEEVRRMVVASDIIILGDNVRSLWPGYNSMIENRPLVTEAMSDQFELADRIEWQNQTTQIFLRKGTRP